MIGNESVAGKGGPARLMLCHHGLIPGSTSAVLPMPELQSGVAILQSSIPAIDTASFIWQMLLEALSGVSQPNDYVALSRQFYDKVAENVNHIRKS